MKKNIEYIAPQIEHVFAVTNEVLCSSYDEEVKFGDHTDDDYLNW